MRNRQTITDELVDIYSLFRLLDFSDTHDDSRELDANCPFKVASLFPKHFLNKVLDEHILEIANKSSRVCEQLFQPPEEFAGLDQQPVEPRKVIKQFFHYSLHYLYDFVTKLNWYDNKIFVSKDSDENKYLRFKDFLKFRNHLDGLNLDIRGKHLAVSPDKSISYPTGSGIRLPRSSLRGSPSSISSSPRGRRRVSFKDGTLSDSALTSRAITDVQLWFALDLQIYAVDLLVQQLCSTLWALVTEVDYAISPGRQRLEGGPSREIKEMNRLYVLALESIQVLCKECLSERMSEIVSNENSKSCTYKLTRIHSYLKWISRDIEGKIISKFAKHFAKHYKRTEE